MVSRDRPDPASAIQRPLPLRENFAEGAQKFLSDIRWIGAHGFPSLSLFVPFLEAA